MLACLLFLLQLITLSHNIYNAMAYHACYALGFLVHDRIVTTPERMIFASICLIIRELKGKKSALTQPSR
jgi:hypothetical protein